MADDVCQQHVWKEPSDLGISLPLFLINKFIPPANFSPRWVGGGAGGGGRQGYKGSQMRKVCRMVIEDVTIESSR